MRARMLLLALGFLACSGGGPGGLNPPPPPGPPPPPPPPPSPIVDVEVRNDVFVPEIASVTAGGTVTWNWSGSGHTVTSVLAPLFNGNTGIRNAGYQFGPLIFNTPGTYDYICTEHGFVQGGRTSGMSGRVVVQ